MHCRQHAAQLRDQYDEITSRGADVVAIGTGDVRYAVSFVKDERVPFAVLVDDDGRAARAASVRTGSMIAIMGPQNWFGTADAVFRGRAGHPPGKRWTQLGATFVVGPGDVVRYEHFDRSPVDHAPFREVLAALDAVAT